MKLTCQLDDTHCSMKFSVEGIRITCVISKANKKICIMLPKNSSASKRKSSRGPIRITYYPIWWGRFPKDLYNVWCFRRVDTNIETIENDKIRDTCRSDNFRKITGQSRTRNDGRKRALPMNFPAWKSQLISCIPNCTDDVNHGCCNYQSALRVPGSVIQMFHISVIDWKCSCLLIREAYLSIYKYWN